MAYDEGLAQRIRENLDDRSGVTKRKMLGGLCFMLNGNMACGVAHEDLMVRVGPDAHADALVQPRARKMDLTGRPMKGFVFVSVDGVEKDSVLAEWIERGMKFASTLPPKSPKK